MSLRYAFEFRGRRFGAWSNIHWPGALSPTLDGLLLPHVRERLLAAGIAEAPLNIDTAAAKRVLLAVNDLLSGRMPVYATGDHCIAEDLTKEPLDCVVSDTVFRCEEEQ